MRLRTGILVLTMAACSVLVPGAVSTASTCSVTWGSLLKTNGVDPGPPLFDVRAGRHTCFDRLVFDVRGSVGDYRVEYVARVRELATGDPVPLRGGAFLEVTVGARVVDDQGRLTYPRAGRSELVNVAGFSTFRQVAWAGSHEGQTEVGLGVRARLPFRVFILAGPGTGSRVVVDVAHRW